MTNYRSLALGVISMMASSIFSFPRRECFVPCCQRRLDEPADLTGKPEGRAWALCQRFMSIFDVGCMFDDGLQRWVVDVRGVGFEQRVTAGAAPASNRAALTCSETFSRYGLMRPAYGSVFDNTDQIVSGQNGETRNMCRTALARERRTWMLPSRIKVSSFQAFKDRKFHVLELAIVVVVEPCADDFLGKQTP